MSNMAARAALATLYWTHHSWVAVPPVVKASEGAPEGTLLHQLLVGVPHQALTQIPKPDRLVLAVGDEVAAVA